MRFTKAYFIFLMNIILLNLGLVYAISANESNYNYFRIHIVANSDSIDDQLLKYTVAKKVNEYTQTITACSGSKEESKQIIEQNIQTILNMCNEIIQENNFNYNVKAYIGKIAYESKQMNNVYMNAGTYDSLKIIIGDGNGQNWWSLIYPTTFNDTSTEDIFSTDVTFSFGIIDWLQNIFTEKTK